MTADRVAYSWGTKRRCGSCGRFVWETKRGKLSRHVDQPTPSSNQDARLSSDLPPSVPRCEGSGS